MKRLLLPGFLSLAAGAMLFAAQPSWWVEEDTKIIAEGREENNYGPANLGQLKNVAKQAKKHLDANLVGGSGTAVNNIVSTFVTSTNPEDIAANYAPLNIGQLKAVAKPFYDRLLASGYDTRANLIARGFSGTWPYNYPWNPSTPASENYVPANIGQLKLVFSFDLAGTDSDTDGLPDWWELGTYGDLASDGTGDWDGDLISDAAEFTSGGNPSDYYSQGSTTISPYLSILGGDGQFGLPNEFLQNPLSVEVRSGSSTGSLLNNAPVRYTVTSGSGALATQFGGTVTSGTLTVRTGTNGQTAAYYKQATAINSTITVQSSTVSVGFTEHATGTNGLVARWPFNEGAGTIAADTIGLSASGTLTNSVSWVDGFDGAKAVGFSGSNYVTMGSPANSSLDFGDGSFSIAVWVKYSDVTMAPGENYQRIVSKGHKGWNGGYVLAIDDEGQIVGGVGTSSTGTSSEALLFSSTNAFNDDEWHHVALVVNATSKMARIYVDGVVQGLEKKPSTGGTVATNAISSSSLTHLVASNTSSAFTVGSYNGSEEYYKGKVDDLSLFREALTAGDVSDLRDIDEAANGLPDWWEGKYFGETGVDLEEDPDDDDLLNWQEYQAGTNPTDNDSDGDDMLDGWEVIYGLNPLNDEDASLDADGDGLTNLQEYQQESDPNDYYSQGSTTISPFIAIAGGNGQAGNAGQFLANALSAEVRSGSSTGALLNNAPVTFVVAEGDGLLAAVFDGTNTSRGLEVKTGTNGVAQAWYKQGTFDGSEGLILALTGTAIPIEFTTITVDLVGHWKLDDGSGVVAADGGPFEFSGTLTGSPAWTERYTGEGAISFNGTTAYVVVGSGTSEMLDFEDSSFSIVAWVKTGTDVQSGRIVSKGDEASNAGYFVGINAEGQVETGLGTTASGTAAETIHVKTTGSFADDTWHHVVAVYDRENTKAHIYVDGAVRVIDKEAGTGGTINVTGSSALDYPTLENLSGSRATVPLTLSSDSGTAAFFKGALDDVRVYRKALKADDVAALYQENGVLLAFSQTVTINEDTLGVVTLQHQGGGNAAVVYSIEDEPADGDTVLEGNILNYYPNAHFSGTNTLTFSVEKGGREAEGNVTIIVTPVNDPPLVSVGGGKSIAMSGSTATLVLSGTVTDIDTDPEHIQLTWIKASGTGAVTFTGTNPLSATATFNSPGEYLLRLSANDGTSTRSDSLVVTVNSSSTSLPTISLEDPNNNSAHQSDDVIAIRAEATANGGRTISKVEFFQGSRKIGEDTTPDPTSGLYELNWKQPRLGAYEISARVTDSAGSQAFSNSRLVRVVELGWFPSAGTHAGNEGFAGSGGSGGVSAGSSTGPDSDNGPGTGGNGGGGGTGPGGNGTGGTAGGGGDGLGNGKDSYSYSIDTDGDGLSDGEEDEIGTNKLIGDTDGDGSEDCVDKYPKDERRTFDVLVADLSVIDITASSSSNVSRIAMDDTNTSYAYEISSDSVQVIGWDNGESYEVQVVNLAPRTSTYIYPPEYELYVEQNTTYTMSGISAKGDVFGYATSGGIGYIYDGGLIHFGDGVAYLAFTATANGIKLVDCTKAVTLEPLSGEVNDVVDDLWTDLDWFNSTHGGPHYWGHMVSSFPIGMTGNGVWYGSDNLFGVINNGETFFVSSDYFTPSPVPSGYHVFEGYRFPRKMNKNGGAILGYVFFDDPGWEYWAPNENISAIWTGSVIIPIEWEPVDINDDGYVVGIADVGGVLWRSEEGGTLTEIKNLLPEDYKNQIKDIGASFVSNRKADDSFDVVFEASSLEGPGEGLWINRSFIVNISGTTSSLFECRIPDEVDIPSGVQSFNKDRIFAAVGRPDEAATQDKAMLFIPIKLEAKDRFISGEIKIPDGWTNLTLKFKENDVELGSYPNIEAAEPEFYIYPSEEEMFSVEEQEKYYEGLLPAERYQQDVVFIRDINDPSILRFYTVCSDYGELDISILRGENEIATLKKTVEYNHDYADIIDFMAERVASADMSAIPQGDDPFDAAIFGLDDEFDGGDILMRSTGVSHDKILAHRNLIAKILIPMLKYNTNLQVSVIKGLVDGMYDGIQSDIQAVAAAVELPAATVAETAKFVAHPYQRASEIYAGVRDLVSLVKELDLNPTMLQMHLIGNLITFESELMGRATNSIVFPTGVPIYDSISERGYVFGYTSGFCSEQVLLGKGVGIVLKGAIRGTLASKAFVSTIGAVKKFSLSTAALAPRVAKFSSTSVRELVGLSKRLYQRSIGSRKAGEIIKKNLDGLDPSEMNSAAIARQVDRAESFIAAGKPWNGIGYNYYLRLAEFLNLINIQSSASSIRGFINFYDTLIPKNGNGADHFQKFTEVLTCKNMSMVRARESMELMEMFDDAASNPSKLGRIPGSQTWKSPGGVEYDGGTSREGHRISHVLAHCIPNYKGTHSVFRSASGGIMEMKNMFALIDEAFAIRMGQNVTRYASVGGNSKRWGFVVQMGRDVGMGSGENCVFILVEGAAQSSAKIISSYPVTASYYPLGMNPVP